MTSQSPRIYTYKITFEEVPYYYYGVHKEKRFDEEYWGTPVTNRWCWELYTPKKQILEVFEYSDEGWVEAQEVEKRIIKSFINDKYCLNENCKGLISIEGCRKGGKKTYEMKTGVYGLSIEEKTKNSVKGGKIGGKLAKELKVGIHGRDLNRIQEDSMKGGKIGGKIGGKKVKEFGIGIFGMTDEERKHYCSKGGKVVGNTTKELGIGIFGMTDEERKYYCSEGGKIGGIVLKEMGLGIFGMTDDDKKKYCSEGGKVANSQKWKCNITGYVSTSAGLSHYQKARGIDKSLRERLS
jgi:hypothetical protein